MCIQLILDEMCRIWKDNPTFYVALIAAFVALVSYLHTRAHNISKNTLEFQTHWNDSPRVDEAWSLIRQMCVKAQGVLSVADAAKNPSSQEAKDLREILNRLECVAGAVEHGLYNEKMLRKNYCGPWLNMWKEIYEDFIQARRKASDNPRAYVQLEKMMDRWQKVRQKEDEKLRQNGKKRKYW